MIKDCIPIAPVGDLPIVCVASGPSLSLKQVWCLGQARSRNLCRVIAVNDAIFPCWFADIGYACDKQWWTERHGVPGFRGIKLSLEPTGFHDVRHLKNTGLKGFDERPGHVRSGGNSGYQAVHEAAKLASRIILVGYDYSDKGAREHFFGPHPKHMDKSSNTTSWLECLKDLTTELSKRRVQVVNATLTSNITWLPRPDLATALRL